MIPKAASGGSGVLEHNILHHRDLKCLPALLKVGTSEESRSIRPKAVGTFSVSIWLAVVPSCLARG